MGGYVTHLLTDSYNGKLLVPVADGVIGRPLAAHGEYDRSHVEQVLRMVDPSARVAFIGGHIGTLVIPVAKKVARVAAIEANPDTFLTLQMNVLLNSCSNVQLIHCAVSDGAGTVQLAHAQHWWK
jgi:predicted RNA methylase